nr:hypothetical protein [Methanobrevibacter arboriphilus]
MKFVKYNLTLIAILFIFSLAINNVSASDYYVNGTNGTDNNIGDSKNPYESIGKAINKTNTQNGSNKVIIRGGEYNGSKNSKITITKNVSIYSASYFYKNNTYGETIINGNENWIFKINSGVTVSFYGITFTNARGNNGGAISINNSKVSVNNCIFKDNNYHEYGIYTRNTKGSGIYVTGTKSVLNVNYCNFTKNYAEYGAGIYGENVNTINVKNSNFEYNSGSEYYESDGFRSGGNGSGIFAKNSKINISSCNFTDNYAITGGAITLSKSISNINSCNFNENNAYNTYCWDDFFKDYAAFGGAIAIFDSIVNISNSNFNNNYVRDGDEEKSYGGAIYMNGSKNLVNIKYSNFIENHAAYGGAISIVGKVNIFYSNFTKNSAQIGGAIFNKDNLILKNSRFINNRAKSQGIVYNFAYLTLLIQYFLKILEMEWTYTIDIHL